MSPGSRAALYSRVSTSDGRQTTANQEQALLEYAQRRGWVPVMFSDTISGAKDKRPGLDALMAAARRREVDVVCIVKLDRLARSVTHLLAISQELQALRCDLVALDQAIDTTSPSGKLTFVILAAVAEFERSLIVDRVKAGLARARAAGKHLGRPRLVVDEARIRTLRESGLTIRQVGKIVGRHHSVIARVLDHVSQPLPEPVA